MAATTALVFLATRQAVQQAHEARYDPLTGLLNRTAFLELVDEALTGKGDHPSIVFLMDLNGFKDVNDRLGHPMGDALLVAFAERLEAGRPSHSHAARLGGDEFAIIADGNSRDPEELAAGLHHYLTEPLTLEGLPVTVGVSIGLAVSGRDGHTTSDLVRAADTAMYKAKRTSASFASYDSGTRSPQHGRRNLLADLNEAITAGQLHLNFQPQLRMVDGAVDTIEALVRWQHPEHGAIPPSEFIGLAEQTDLIRPITDLVLRTATHSLMSGDSAVRLAVNVSARSLQDKMFAPEVFEILDETGFPAYRLELEVTERALAENAERIRYTVSKLRDAGIRVAIDDFGSGSSSYQTLRMLDVDRIKIDRSLVQGILASERDRTIVRSLVVLAHELGLDVVAEGIESSRVWNALIEMGCDVGQGFGIAVPMADAATHDWLTQWDSVALAEPPLPRRIRFANLDQ
jgi:diguanylate cyclase (GGDEF)-like protein